MILSYLGLSAPVSFVNECVQRYIIDYRKSNDTLPPPLSCGGVYTNDFKAATSFAAENDMGVFIKAEDLFEKSDIIFVFLPDSALKTLASSLKGHGIRNKIIVHFSPAYCADVLDFGPENTYACVYLPFTFDTSVNHDAKLTFYIQGYGNRLDDFVYILRMMSIVPVIMDKDERMLIITAVNFRSKLTEVINRTSLKLIDISLSTKPQVAKKLLEEFDNNCYTWISYDAVKSKNTDFIQTQREVISGLSYSDAENLLGLLYRIENSADNNIDYYNFIKDISDKMLKK